MTLITYPTRVHFADDVMHEALHSELERIDCGTVMLICAHELQDGDLHHQVQEGLPGHTKVQNLFLADTADLSRLSRSAIDTRVPPDVIIAFGSARAIELARKCRYALTVATKRRPLLYAIPGVEGLPGPCTRNLESWRAGLPSVLIYDPTLTIDAGPTESWRSAVLSLVRCVESYLAQSFNPPADGMALDGMGRSLETLPRIAGTRRGADKLTLQRDVMAASLNASLSQEKGIGPALTLADALANGQAGLSVSEIARLLLPEIIRKSNIAAARKEMLLRVLGREDQSLEEAMRAALAEAPMPERLADMGIDLKNLDTAAAEADGKAGLTRQGARDLLEAVF